LVLGGILLMQQTGSTGWLPALPTFFLSAIFPNPLWVLYGTLVALIGCVGVILFLPGFLAPAPYPAAAGAGVGAPWFNGRLHPAGLVALGLALPLYALALLAAQSQSTGYGQLVALALAVLLGASAIRLFTTWPAQERRQPWLLPERLFVVSVLLVFTVLAGFDVRDWYYSYWGDEWPFYDLGRYVATGGAVNPFSQAGVYGIHPWMDAIYQGLVMRILGINVLGWRLSSVLATTLPVLPLYALGRRLGGPLFAGVSVLLYAICPLLWAFAHIGYNNDDPLFPMVLAALLCYRGTRESNAMLLYLAGACAGACWYSIFTGRLIGVVLVLLLLSEWRGGLLALLRRLLFFLLGLGVVVLPLLLDNGLNTFRAMSHNTPLSTTHDLNAYLTLVSQNAGRAVYAFLYSTTSDHYVAGALFDPVAGTALCLGVALALRDIGSLYARLLLIWLVVTLGLTTPLNDSAGVSLTRSMVAIPPAALLAASGLLATWLAMARLVATRTGRLRAAPWQRVPGMAVLAGGTVLSLLISLSLNLQTYYVTVPSELYTPYPQVRLIVKDMLATPGAAFILPPQMPSIEVNREFCSVLDGYGLNPALVVFPQGGALLPYCTVPGGNAAVLPSTAVLLVADPQTANACSVRPGLVLSELQGTIWAFTLSLTPDPAATYMTRLYALALQTCPSLFH
jgi:hypothetical protein